MVDIVAANDEAQTVRKALDPDTAATDEFVLGRGAPTQWRMWREPR
jgi:hypothetical protein